MTRERHPLTPRERQILALIREGHTSHEIGAQLGIAKKTVEGARVSIRVKYRARNTAALVTAVFAEEGRRLQ